ncbi:MAG: MBL fold metallo-hydrolase, partial [Alphaproteobacteria bacterium]|nr:MBL fold metallo-hydrolase [Alphaproteobacteria bacterium]
PPAIFRADVSYNDFEAGEIIELEEEAGVTIRTIPLNHPNGATGYRVEYGGKSACYITDTEHVAGTHDQEILNLIEGCDLFIYDSTYTEEEYKIFAGFGHSTWEEAVKLADLANVKMLYLFHHDPSHDDEKMDEILADAKMMRKDGVDAAREGETIKLL